MKIKASILDYSYPFLDPAVWDQDQNLYAYQKDFILRMVNKMCETYGLVNSDTWIEDIVIIGSLTTSKWLLTSDLDVHIRVNLEAFKANVLPQATVEQAFEELDTVRKMFDRAKILAPMTQHPIEFYFESISFRPSNTALVGVYSVLQNKWVKEPIMFDADLDFEESKKDVIAQAEALAEELDSSLGKIQRDIQRVDELEAVINAWDNSKQQLFYAKVEQKLKAIEAEILKDIKVKQDLVDARHADQNATSEIEIKFKWLARFGFFGILSNLKTLMEQTGGKITTQELPLIDKIISQGSLDKKSLTYGYWIAPDGKEFVVSSTHDQWVRNEADFLKNTYNIDVTNDKPAVPTLIDNGWTRVTAISDGQFTLLVKDISNLSSYLDNFIAQHFIPNKNDGIIVEQMNDKWIEITDPFPSIQQAVNKALQRKRMGTIKEAGYGHAYWIDPQGKLYTVRPNTSPDFYTHSDWIADNSELLKEQYGIDSDDTYYEMLTDGWARIGDSGHSGSGYGITVGDLGSIPTGVDAALAQFYTGGTLEVEGEFDHRMVVVDDPFPNIQKAVNKAIQRKRMGSIKEAFLKQAFEEPNEADTDICVDFDKTIAQDAKYPAIGEPIEGAKESLEKLKDLGYNVVIYSCRGDSEEGLELMTKWLDDHDMPYDSIFEGEKPFFKYVIDDKAIHFDTWDKALKQVEKFDKVASIHIISAARYWIDPAGKIYPLEDTHEGWILDNTKLLQEQYGLWQNHPEELYPEETDNVDAIIPKMLQDGWARVGDLFGSGRSSLGQGIEVADLHNVPSSVFNFMSNFGPGKYFMIEDLRKQWVELPVEDLLTDGQQAINQALQRKRMTHAAIELQTIDPKTFKRKEPYALFIGTGNYGKAGKIDMFNVYGEHPMITESNVLPTVTLDTLIQQNIPIIGKEPRAGDKQPFQDISGLYKQAQTKKVKQGSYSCLMALLPHEIAQEIVEFGVRTVPDDKLYLDEDGKLGRELESHITIKYGLLTNDAKHVRRSFNHDKPFKATLGKVRHFQPPELPFDVLTVEIISDDLVKANKKVCDNFDCAKGLVSDEYKPHITIAYMKRDTAEEYIGSDEFEGKEIELDTVIFSPHKGNRTYFSISQDKESQFTLEKIVKFADYGIGNWAESAWISPSGEVFDLEGDSHEDAIYNLINDPEIYNQEDPLSYAIGKGWTRFGEMGGGGETGANVKSIRNINSSVFNHAMKYTGQGKEMVVADLSGAYVHMPVDEFVLGQKAVNKALMGQPKRAEFLPSLFNAPDNEWQFEEGGDDKEIALNPDSVSDETTWYAPCTEGKPRTKEVWRQFLSMFTTPFSKKEDVQIEAVYDKELEEAEKNALGEDQTLLEYSKGFYDPKDHDFPHNTTWDSLTQDGEPSKPTSVTYSPQISNEDNLDQNSPGGYPRRFMGKPKGEWFSNEGEVNNALIDMLKNREAALDSMTKIAGNADGGWISPTGQYIPTSDHFGYVATHLADFGLSQLEESTQTKFELDSAVVRAMQYIFDQGWLRVRVWGDAILIQGNNINNVKSHAEDFIYDNLEGAKRIRIETDNEQAYTCTTDEFKAEGWDAFLKQPIMAKQAASIEDVNGVKVLVNPTPNELQGLFARSKNQYLRALVDPNTGDIFAWDGYQSEHNRIINYYGLDINWENDDGTYIRHVSSPSDIEQLFDIQAQVRTKLARRKRKASIEEIDGLPVLVNPTENELKGFSRNLKGGHMFRGLIDPHTGDLFVWDAYEAIHTYVIQKLGLDVKYSDQSPFCLYFPPSDIYDALARQQEVKRGDKLRSTGSLDKTSGDQSASVPDYLIDEWKTDQLHDDISEEPYVNHDQRDYPYGMHDSPENTAFNIGWAKDNQPYVVRLDILEDPAYRLDPFGIGEYTTTWYTSLPASDGIEQTNPD